MLSNLGISKKLYLGFSIMIFIIIAITLVGIMKVNSIDEILNKIVEVNSVKQRYAINFRGSVHDRAIAIRDIVLAKDTSDQLYIDSLNDIKKLEEFYAQSAKPLDDIFQSGMDVDDKERDILRRIKEIEVKTLPVIEKIINFKVNAMEDQARELLVNDARVNTTIWLGIINEFIDYQELKNQTETPIAREISSSFSFIMLTILGVSVVIAGVISFLISTDMIKSVSKVKAGLQGFFDFLNKKTSNATLIDMKSEDEFGQMATTINTNIKEIEKAIQEDDIFVNDIARFAQEIGSGNLSASIEKGTKTESLLELKSILTKMQQELEQTIATSIPELLSILNEFKEQDFTSKLPNAKAKVSVAINELGDVISKLLNNSLNIGKSLEQSSEILISNVNDLNNSSNKAATSLVETSAVLEKITVTVKSNSNNVTEMSSYAKEVDSSAKEGQKYAQDTSSAMSEIEEQIYTINEAITVIDQIAFQTNILSLNAAVEAATAGEAGKGFAVVAQEVRNLATRSAEAAKEIKNIVETATSKASYGKDISDKMFEGYNELLENIDKTMNTIESISSASREQENGILQINDAIVSLEKQTQKNATVASQTKDIAMKTDSIAKEIVSDLSTKKFNIS